LAVSGLIRIFDLYSYLQPKVVGDQAHQHPIFRAEIEDNFPVALAGGVKAAVPAPRPLPQPTPAPTVQTGDGFTYDVFLSYRDHDPDKTWARKTLMPRLEQEGLKVIEQRRFRLGAPLVKEMERAVTQSRFTLSVLTPSYVEGNFTDLESVLAEHLGLENSQRRLLTLMREYCKPRLGMRARIGLDMTEDDEFEDNLERLVYELKQPPV
jgi:hypothetical protein